jgi:hypothetical protein
MTEEPEEVQVQDEEAPAVAEENKPEPVQIAAPVSPQAPQPTAAQHAWMQAHPQFVRLSHSRAGRFQGGKGTLRADGTFILEKPGFPIHDGNGDFGVGVPLISTKRKW